jgi:hypothetical protein
MRTEQPWLEAATLAEVDQLKRQDGSQLNHHAILEFLDEQSSIGDPLESVPDDCFGNRSRKIAGCVEDEKIANRSAEARVSRTHA